MMIALLLLKCHNRMSEACRFTYILVPPFFGFSEKRKESLFFKTWDSNMQNVGYEWDAKKTISQQYAVRILVKVIFLLFYTFLLVFLSQATDKSSFGILCLKSSFHTNPATLLNRDENCRVWAKNCVIHPAVLFMQEVANVLMQKRLGCKGGCSFVSFWDCLKRKSLDDKRNEDTYSRILFTNWLFFAHIIEASLELCSVASMSVLYSPIVSMKRCKC